jgi:uncharacterized protein YfaT (DUF1175 family)
LGLSEASVKADPVSAGLNLALEWTAIAYDLQTQLGMFSLFSDQYQLTDVNHQPITQPVRQSRVGASLYFHFLEQLPAFSLNAQTIPDLIVAATAVKAGLDVDQPQVQALSPAISVLSHHSRDQVVPDLVNFIKGVSASTSLLPPPLTLSPALRQVRQELYDLKNSPRNLTNS